MKQLSSLPIESILTQYPWPHRFIVAFAVTCAERAMASVKDPDPSSLKAISLAKRFSQGEDIAQEELKDAADSAHYAAYYAAYAAYHASYAAPANAAYYAAYYAPNKIEKELKKELIAMIKKEFSEFELILMGVIE